MKLLCPRDGCGRVVATTDHQRDVTHITTKSRNRYIGRKGMVTETTTAELGPEPWRVRTGVCTRCGQWWVVSLERITEAAAARRRSVQAVAVRSPIHRRGHRRPLP